ncbi:MAG: aminoacyl-tRNA hydrolase [Candidatus Daviesbacteria bacterium]|nr:aminoacyl-tRNA hydrolase [Candidatus Daviesbacteria bacterium]
MNLKLIVGLGNPGEKYENTRHNLGFRVVDELSEKIEGGEWKLEKKFKSEILLLRQAQDQDDNLILVKPQTFMNESGLAVKLLADYYKISVEDIIIIHDDVDIVLGKIKVRQGGSGGGHHGVESIIKQLLNDQFVRVRLGIGGVKRLSEERNIEKFVLETFLPNERSKVKHMIKTAVGAIKLLLEKGLEKAQNQYN